MPLRPNLTVRKSSLESGVDGETSRPSSASAELITSERAAELEAIVPRKVLLVRHGEGTHNVRAQRWGGGNPYNTLDPSLTVAGLGQAKELAQDPRLADPELLVVSPLSRAVETAAAAFGEQPRCRTVLTPLHSERWSALCDQGRSKSELAELHPFVRSWEGFGQMPEDWTPTQSSDAEWQRTRVPAFVAWLKEQPESRIVVVGHGAYFAPLLGGKHLKNCEVATIEA